MTQRLEQFRHREKRWAMLRRSSSRRRRDGGRGRYRMKGREKKEDRESEREGESLSRGNNSGYSYCGVDQPARFAEVVLLIELSNPQSVFVSYLIS